ncbi:CDP-alcohol phosphatidyltransferase family protein [Shimia thalassica]|uniref:CDP-alcohol phosphatidyltransferase family protein n=1 Tax=Shimia thalassica TaxID=1715693 RepID=UPI001C096449|nr:CDP-alcohol phosphatidyltransferase family protein [Shimia thalassica]MBU2944838.1 CDP-alcohol phosphatidyltransferase family protein [Shimia thalassica]MDO6504857.1 CDP-alcohol phosphatidyltransferase family protein [Shimia thalassica]
MIDGLIKSKIDPIWESLSTPLVRAGWTPNQVTFAGLVLIIVTSLAYLWHRSELIYGLTLAVAFAFDALDGAVARRRDMCSKAGGYFDAMVDRYQELAVLATLAFVHDLWALALAAFSGSVLTSYAKARTAIEIEISNDDWPDFFERLERIIFICVFLVLAGIFDAGWIVTAGLGIFALLSHFTALQRAWRATQMLKSDDQASR